MRRSYRGSGNPKYRHGFCGTPVYKVWENMQARCQKPGHRQFADYGGRGIKVCESWLKEPGTFCEWALRSGYAPGLMLDRIDNNGDYEPGNCRFVHRKVNNNNKRNNRVLRAFGELKTLAQWAEDYRCAVSYSTLIQRLDKLGWPFERALITPRRSA